MRRLMKMLRFRFTLRTLLVAVVIIAGCLGWYVDWRQTKRDLVILHLGGSRAMEPFISARALIVADMNAYRKAKPARWEAVVFRLQPPTPGQVPTACILRVVGLPGETVSFSEGKIVIDSQPMVPPTYLPAQHEDEANLTLNLQNVRYHMDVPGGKLEPHPYTVPHGCYYLLGDNPDEADDSRMWGALPAAEILGGYPSHGIVPNRAWPKIYIATLVVLAVLCRLFFSWWERRGKGRDDNLAPTKRVIQTSVSLFGWIVGTITFFCSIDAAAQPTPTDDSSGGQLFYHANRDHLWNRLHEAIFVRIGPDRRAYGHDRLDPLLWQRTKHLLEDRSRDRALAALEEFIRSDGQKMIEDPLKRAVLQRDLWLVFNWLEGDHRDFEEPPISDPAWRASREQLRRPLATVIGRLALTPSQIEQLPDNFKAAVASGQFASAFDAARPEVPYLPPDLFAVDGPWVCLGRSDGPVAPEHLREDRGNPVTNSIFLVFLRLPAGRTATLDYLERLRSFDQPLLVPLQDAGSRTEKYLPNPKLRSFPVGTEVALVRRALLIASTHTPVPSDLTESVQLRVYREIPEMTIETMNAALGGGAAARQAQLWQTFHEFRLSRSSLFAGHAGGLRAVGTDERDFKTGFGAHAWDEFERPIRTDQSFPETGQRFTIKQTCFTCHSHSGVYSFNSYFNFRIANLRTGDTSRPALLMPSSLAEANGATVEWQQGRPIWLSLRALLVDR